MVLLQPIMGFPINQPIPQYPCMVYSPLFAISIFFLNLREHVGNMDTIPDIDIPYHTIILYIYTYYSIPYIDPLKNRFPACFFLGGGIRPTASPKDTHSHGETSPLMGPEGSRFCGFCDGNF